MRCSSRRSCGQRDGRDPMFERGVCHLDNHFIGSQAVRLNDDRAAFALGCVQCRSELIECDLLIPEINRGSCATGDADDLLIDLRTKRKPRERHRNRNSRLQNKIRTEQQKENQEKNDVQQREKDEPAEVIFLRPAELHARAEAIVDLAIETCFPIAGCWKLMIPLSGRLSVNMCTISMPARSISCSIVFTRAER